MKHSEQLATILKIIAVLAIVLASTHLIVTVEAQQTHTGQGQQMAAHTINQSTVA